MANQEKKRRQEPDVHQPIKEPSPQKGTEKAGQKEAKPDENLKGRNPEPSRH
jgi:hypothetical protein